MINVRNSKGLAEFMALIAVMLAAILLYALGIFGQLSFEVKQIEFALREESESKLFTLMSSTHEGYTIDNLIGYYLLSTSDKTNRKLEKPVEIVDMERFLKQKLDSIEDIIKFEYKFTLPFKDEIYFEIISSPQIKENPALTYLIPLPYNPTILITKARLVEWT